MGRAKILVVDDSEKNVELLEAILQAADFEVLKAYNGKQAIEMVGKERPDLILLDLMMPSMNGYQVCQTLRKDIANASLPIIAITAVMDQPEDYGPALTAGFDAYIVKPFKKEELISKIEDLLSQAKKGTLPSHLSFRKDQRAQEGSD